MSVLRKELKERFLSEFTMYEQAFFLRKAREAIFVKRYRASEDLFHYCYFLTLKERLREIPVQSGEGMLRYLLVESAKDIDEAIRIYEERLDKQQLPEPDREGVVFIDNLS